jgi:hypothetical protein
LRRTSHFLSGQKEGTEMQTPAVTFPVDSPLFAWLAAQPEKCSVCGIVKPEGEMTVFVHSDLKLCDGCYRRKGVERKVAAMDKQLQALAAK